MSPPTRHEKVFCENFFSAAISRCAALAANRKCVCVLHSPSGENIEKKQRAVPSMHYTPFFRKFYQPFKKSSK